MFRTSKGLWSRVVFIVLAIGVLGLSLMPLAFSVNFSEDKPVLMNQDNIIKLQETLRDKGYYSGKVDGVLGHRTREGIRQYQKSENLPVTGHLDGETAGKLGMGPESVGGSFKDAGQEVGKGGAELGREMKEGKPIAGGKEMGKSIGRAGNKVGQAIKKAVSPDSDRGDQEKK
jgi:peptidoglycan hydrolase-like protein with peptidoglycan-binding domain